ncbi:MAG TPA: hypothetical protein VN428_21815 [Bryobacteraceae bacterium]|nr:hypothetical protein [Bryobacteraceae bacterium]
MRRFAFGVVLAVAAAAQQPPTGDLRIVKPALRQYEDGPALPAGQTVSAGETLFFSFNVQGYRTAEDRRYHLRWTVDVLDSQGVPLDESVTRDLEGKLSAEDKDWMPVARRSFMVPPLVFPGEYKVTAKVEDVLAKRTAAAEVKFRVRGREIAPSETLTARNFRFLRAEEDINPLNPAVYRAGDTVWARFDIVGFKHGERNRMQVSYGIGIALADGKVLFSQAEAATEQNESFYPQKYVPGVVSVTTQKNTQPGDYLLVLTLRDLVGSQVTEEKHPFRVE